MRLRDLSISLFGAAALLVAVLATALLWLLLSDPITVVDAVQEGNVSPLVTALARVLYSALLGLLKYL